MDETSIITDTRRENLCRLTCGEISFIPPVTMMAFGDGGADEDGNPLIALSSQTELHHEILRLPIGEISRPIPTTASYKVIIGVDKIPGAVISEIALVNAEGELDVIKNCRPKAKDEGTIFEFTINDVF